MRPHYAPDRKPTRPRQLPILVLASAGGVLGYAVLLAGMAFAIESAGVDRATAVTWLTGGSIVAGVIYLASLPPLVLAMTRRSIVPGVPGVPGVPSLWIIIIVALCARLIVIVAPPLDESGSQDYHRYLWDGALGANGFNPYRYSPAEVLDGEATGLDEDRIEWGALAHGGDNTLRAINHPRLTTIYPPLAQLGFALGYWIEPFGTTGWRVVLLLAEGITVVLLLRILKALALPVAHIAWFVWNPLLLREIHASLHMDMLVLPLLAGAVLAGVEGVKGLRGGRWRSTLGALLCVAGSAVKVWPIMLTPLLLRLLIPRPPRPRPRRCPRGRDLIRGVLALALCAALFLALWAPMLGPRTLRSDASGFMTYVETWQNNDGFFRVGVWLTEHALIMMNEPPWESQRIMRTIAGSLVCIVVLWQCRSRAKDGRDLARRCLIIVGAIFLLSPTQFPWYWLWCLPLLTLRPYPPLLLYTALLPLYYVQELGAWTLWLQHAPIWLMLGWETIRAWKTARAKPGDVLAHPEFSRGKPIAAHPAKEIVG